MYNVDKDNLLEDEKLTQRNLDKYLWSALPPWKIPLDLMLKPGENLDVAMTVEKQMPQIKVNSFNIKVSLKNSSPTQAKGENLTDRARKQYHLHGQSKVPKLK